MHDALILHSRNYLFHNSKNRILNKYDPFDMISLANRIRKKDIIV